MPTAADEEALSTAALNRHLSRRRETAANFKKVAAPAEYRRFHIDPHPLTEDDRSVLAKIRHAVSLRDECLYKRRVPEWLNYSQPTGISDDPAFVPPPYDPFDPKLPPPSNHVAQWQDGVVHVFSSSLAVMRRQSQFKSITLQRFAEQLHTLMGIMNDPECRSFCYRRLMLLEERFNMYLILNDGQERLSQIAVPHRDFYNVHKVDVHGKSTSSGFCQSAHYSLVMSHGHNS